MPSAAIRPRGILLFALLWSRTASATVKSSRKVVHPSGEINRDAPQLCRHVTELAYMRGDRICDCDATWPLCHRSGDRNRTEAPDRAQIKKLTWQFAL